MSETSRHDRLTEDRDRLEAAIQEADARTLPALVREHRAVLKEIESLATPTKGSVRDQLAERRRARSGSPAADAGGQAGAAGSSASEV